MNIIRRSLLFFAGFALAVSAIAADPSPSTCVAIRTPNHRPPAGVFQIWGDSTKFWKNGSVITVQFLEGSARQQDAAWKRFQVLNQLTGLQFVRATKPPGMVRVAFNPNNGHWSYVGTDILTAAPKSRPTMNLALSAQLIGGDPDREWDRVAIHEILHTCGMMHEHQHPQAGIPWNKPAVYAYYGQTQGWSKAQIDYQVLNRWKGTTFNGTAFDPDSIMEYPIPANLTTNGFSVGWNSKLSPNDIAFLAKLYPHPAK